MAADHGPADVCDGNDRHGGDGGCGGDGGDDRCGGDGNCGGDDGGVLVVLPVVSENRWW